MDTEYCEKCGLLHDPEDGECLGCKMVGKIKLLERVNSICYALIGLDDCKPFRKEFYEIQKELEAKT